MSTTMLVVAQSIGNLVQIHNVIAAQATGRVDRLNLIPIVCCLFGGDPLRRGRCACCFRRCFRRPPVASIALLRSRLPVTDR
jgi:hypothetical protein